MTTSQKKKIIERLRNDDEYFGELGSQYLSNSDMKILIEKPDLYGTKWSTNVDFLKGKYLHHKILQPELFEVESNYPMTIVDCNTRNHKEYKDIVYENTLEGIEKPLYLLKKEVEEMNLLAKKVLSNSDFRAYLTENQKPNEIEEPEIMNLFGYWFKGKADRINEHMGIVADFKTTRSLSSFTTNFRKYGYHGQAFIYKELFGMPVEFFVIDKETGRLGRFQVSEETLSEGRDYVLAGIENLEYYYGDNKEGNIDQYYDTGLI